MACRSPHLKRSSCGCPSRPGWTAERRGQRQPEVAVPRVAAAPAAGRPGTSRAGRQRPPAARQLAAMRLMLSWRTLRWTLTGQSLSWSTCPGAATSGWGPRRAAPALCCALPVYRCQVPRSLRFAVAGCWAPFLIPRPLNRAALLARPAGLGALAPAAACAAGQARFVRCAGRLGGAHAGKRALHSRWRSAYCLA